MDPENDKKAHEEIRKFLNFFMMYKLREIAGEFPNKVRFDMFFPRDEGRQAHFIEVEQSYSAEALREAEVYFLEWEKQQAVEAAKKFMEGGGQ